MPGPSRIEYHGAIYHVISRGDCPIPDFYGQNEQDIREFIEVKNGPGTTLNPNQERFFPIIEQSGGVPVGGNAVAASGC